MLTYKTLTELTQEPLDALLAEGRDPLVLLQRPGVMETWEQLSEEDAIWWLVSLAQDARALTLPVWGRYSTAGYYAVMLQAIVMRADGDLTQAASTLRGLVLLDPPTCVGAGLLLLAAWRTEVNQRMEELTRTCPHCRRELSPAARKRRRAAIAMTC